MASPPFTPNEAVPGDQDIVSQFPAAERLFRDILESWLLFEHHTTGRHSFPTDITANLAGLSGQGIGNIRYDTTLDVLQYHSGSAFKTMTLPSGTRQAFQQSSAPPGWTLDSAAVNEKAAIRLRNTATGFSNGFGSQDTDTVFTNRTPTGSVSIATHTLTTAEIPSHQHLIKNSALIVAGGAGVGMVQDNTFGSGDVGGGSEFEGGGGAHGHPGSTFTGNAMDFSLKFVDFLICTKA